MSETLLSPSMILLYGRQMLDLTLEPPSVARTKTAPHATDYEGEDAPDPPLELPVAPPSLGDNTFLQKQLEANGARLARIYAFSFEGAYYDLARPAIFLVHGPGSDPEAFRPAPALPGARVSRAPADADRTGVANTPSSFSEDIRVWAYDKSDHSLRLDPEAGTLEQILLERCLIGNPGALGAGAHGAGAYGAGAFGAGAFGAGAFGAGAFGRGRRGGGD